MQYFTNIKKISHYQLENVATIRRNLLERERERERERESAPMLGTPERHIKSSHTK